MKKLIMVAALILALFLTGRFGFLLGSNSIDLDLSEQEQVQLAFARAAARGDLEQVKALHSQGAALDVVPTTGPASEPPAIHAAASRGQYHVVAWLIQNGSNVNLDVGPTRPLDMAESNLRAAEETVRVLKNAGSKRWDDDSPDPATKSSK